MKKIRVKAPIIEPFLVPHQADITLYKAQVIARYVEIVSEIEITVENTIVSVEQIFYWDGTEQEFQQMMTDNLASAMSKFKKEIAHNVYLDTILLKRTS